VNRIGDEKSSMRGFTSFLEVSRSCSDDRRGKGVAGCRGPWSKTMELNGFAILTFPRTPGFSCSRAESATGRTLSLASADVLVQIRLDLRLRFAAFPPARRAITILPPPQGPRSVRIRAVPSVVFSSTASDVLHTRPCCSCANPPATVAQLLPHRVRPSCTPLSCTSLQHPPDGVLHP
jgi:hypothetical protein